MHNKPSLRSLEHLLGYHLRRASMRVQADLSATLAAYDLRMITFSALAVVCDHPRLRQRELADALAIERSNLVMIVDELENRGLVRREPDPTDRRAYAISLTDKGTDLFQKALSAVNHHETALFDSLNTRTRSTLKEILIEIERISK